MNMLIVACRTIADELNMVMKETNCKYPILWINSGLHMEPDSLRKKIQEELDHISNVDQVLLAFGFCGNSLLGITATNCRVVFPRVDDCITLILGSCQRRKEVSDEVGTYFLTKGWLDYETNIWVEYQATVKRMGKERAERIYKMLLKHYKRLGVIQTGAYDLEEFLEKTQKVAEDLNLTHEVIPGTLRYMKKLLTGPWDEEFVVINQGEKVELVHTQPVEKEKVLF